jgi:hypothetical protein
MTYGSINILEQAAKHLRRLSVIGVTCHDNCMCNGTCEHPDRIKAEEIIAKLAVVIQEMKTTIYHKDI